MDEMEYTEFTGDADFENDEDFTDTEVTDSDDEWDQADTPDNMPTLPTAAAETFRLRHLGQEHEVTREEVIALAQKGRDYDRIRERLVRLESGGEAAVPGRREMLRNVHDFISEYGGRIDPATIPGEVWTDVRAGTPLVVAYQRHENRELSARLRGNQNRARAAGGAKSAGESGVFASIESDWYSD